MSAKITYLLFVLCWQKYKRW